MFKCREEVMCEFCFMRIGCCTGYRKQIAETPMFHWCAPEDEAVCIIRSAEGRDLVISWQLYAQLLYLGEFHLLLSSVEEAVFLLPLKRKRDRIIPTLHNIANRKEKKSYYQSILPAWLTHLSLSKYTEIRIYQVFKIVKNEQVMSLKPASVLRS